MKRTVSYDFRFADYGGGPVSYTHLYLKTHYDLAIILIAHDLDYVAKYADHVAVSYTHLMMQTVTTTMTTKQTQNQIARTIMTMVMRMPMHGCCLLYTSRCV